MKNILFIDFFKTLNMLIHQKKAIICKKGKIRVTDFYSIKIDGKLIFNLSHYKNDYFKPAILNIRKHGKLEINGTVRIFTGAKIDVEENAQLIIKDGVQINDDAKIGIKKYLSIGNNTLIGDNVCIHDFDGHYIIKEGYRESIPVKIGNNVWIGANVTILKGVTIGDYAIIGANSVVTTDVPPHSLAVGNPAVVKKNNITWEK